MDTGGKIRSIGFNNRQDVVFSAKSEDRIMSFISGKEDEDLLIIFDYQCMALISFMLFFF
jgi:hypothetical protein